MSNSNTQLKLSVITSCSSLRLAQLTRELADAGVRYVDLYLLREDDIAELTEDGGIELSLKTYSGEHKGAMSDRMLGALTSSELGSWLVERVDDQLEVTGVATNIPHIATPVPPGLMETACEALGRVWQVTYEHWPTAVIEVVAGPRANRSDLSDGRKGVVPADRRQFQAISSSSLDNIREQMSLQDGNEGRVPVLAFEMEPAGDAFLLRDTEACRRLFAYMKRYDEHPVLGDSLGLNLDIGHFIIASEHKYGDPVRLVRDLRNDPGFGELVRHAHISDHWPYTHGPDEAPFTHHGQDVFAEWLSLYHDIGRDQQQHGRRWSGVVALEMETARDIGEVLTAYEQVRRLIDEMGYLSS